MISNENSQIRDVHVHVEFLKIGEGILYEFFF